jgi:hypothetical protein
MAALRATPGIGRKKRFKDVGFGPSWRKLPAYFALTDQCISGLLSTLSYVSRKESIEKM